MLPRSLLALALAIATALGKPVPRSNLTDPSARCLDGTLSAFYLQPGSVANRSRFIIYLDGGGEVCSWQAGWGAIR